MPSLSNGKTLGGVGSILAIIPFLSIIGWILILVALKDLSDVTQDKSIFDDALIAAITSIIGAAAFVAILVLGWFVSIVSFGFAAGGLGVLGALTALSLFWAIFVVSAFFLKRAYDKLAQHLKVGSFATAGLLYLIGALTTIVLVGFLIIFIAQIFQIVAYFSIQDQPAPMPYPGYQAPQPMYPSSPAAAQTISPPVQPIQPLQPQAAQQQPVMPEFKFCFKCGTKLPASAVYCTSCGTKQ